MACPEVTIQTILGTECIGDSLPKINTNFSELGDAACDLYSKVEDAIFIVACSDEGSSLSISPSATTFYIPFNMTLTSALATVTTAPSGSSIVVDIKTNSGSIFSSKPTIASGQFISGTSTISSPFFTENQKITLSIDSVGSSKAGSGLKMTLKGNRTSW